MGYSPWSNKESDTNKQLRVEVTNRFKRLDLTGTVPEKLWMENIVQEVVIKTIPKKKKYKNVKWLSDEALQIAEQRREAKGKREKKTYTHLNAEFQRIARRDRKAFPSDQCKEIEENNRTGKTRNVFKKIRDTKGTFHVKMSTIKDRNLTEAEDIKKRWQEHKELYKKDLHVPDNHDSVITHLEPDILECAVKWALGSSGGDGIPVISSPKRRCCGSAELNMPVNLEISAVATELKKVSLHSNLKERQYQRMFQLPHNCTHLTRWPSDAQNSPSQASTVCET